MSRKRAVFGVAVGGMLCIAAYVSANHALNPAVADSGGGEASSPNYETQASIGGSVVSTDGTGTATSANYAIDVNTVAIITPPPVEGGGGGGGNDGGCVPGACSPSLLLGLAATCLAMLRRR